MKRKPTSQHVAQGTYRDDRHGARLDVVVPAGVPLQPAGLNQSQRDLWDAVCNTLPQGCLGECDTAALIELVEAARLTLEARAQLSDDVTDRNARIAYNGYQDRYIRLLKEFGLTPLSRSAVKVPVTTESDEPDPMGEILQMFQRSI